MTDIVNKLIAVFLICVMLLLAPLSVMQGSDRAQNKISAVNAMELFLDTVTDAHLIDSSAVDRLVTTLESCGMTVSIRIETYEVVIAKGETYMWKTGIINNINNPTEIELGDIVSLTVTEQTSSRAQNLWTKLFGSSVDIFDETLVKMVK